MKKQTNLKSPPKAGGITIALILLLAAASLAFPSAALAQNFSSAWTSTNLDNSQAAAWGDFDNDGNYDVVVASNSYLRVYFKDAAMTFTTVWTQSTTDTPRGIAVCDFNGDGYLDFFVGNNGQASTVYLNNQNRTFTSTWSTAADSTHTVACGDINGDGGIDLFTGNYGTASKFYTKDSGANTWTAIAWTTGTDNAESSALGDYDGDGDIDLLIGNYSQAKMVYRNNSNDTFTLVFSSTETEQTSSVAWADYDGDGDLDFAVGNNGQQNRVYRNNGDNTFTPVWQAASSYNTRSVAWGDYDADGQLDLLVGNFSQANILYRKDSGDTFTSSFTTSETDATTAVAWFDVDKDGDLDCSSANSSVQGFRVYTNNINPSNSAPSAPVLSTTSNTPAGTVTFNWTPSTDDHTPGNLLGYLIRIGTTSGGYQTVPGFYTGYPGNIHPGVATYTVSIPTDGTYYWSVSAIDTSGFSKSSWGTEKSFIVDSTSPLTAGATIYDGTGVAADSAYSTSSIQLSANWAGFSDPQSGISLYQYAIGTATSSTNLVNWTDNGTSTAVTKTGLAVANGTTYYVSVRAQNSAGTYSSPVQSDGQMVDYTAPASVNPVNDGTGADLDYTPDATQLSANWTASTDSQSGIENYWYAIGTATDPTHFVNWTSTTNTFITDTTGFTQGETYYFTVRARNNAGLYQTVSSVSDGIKVDNTAPSSVATIYRGSTTAVDNQYSTSASELSANWATSSDVQSGITKYYYAIGTTAGATDIVGWTDNGTDTSVTHTGLSLTNGSNYYFTIKAENGSTLQSTPTNSAAILVDNTEPANVATVYDGTGIGSDITYATSTTTLSANWTSSTDSQSGMRRYWYAIGTTSGSSDIVGWTDNGLATSVTRTGLTLVNGTVYYFTVKAENNAGLISLLTTSSNGQKVDVTTATGLTTVNDGSSADIDYQTSLTTISANWSGVSDSESGIAKYYYAIGTTVGGTQIANWTDNGTAGSFTKTGLTLTQNIRYYVSVKVENGAGLISSVVTSDGVRTDNTAPSDIASAYDGTGSDITYVTSNTTLSANWTTSADAQSGIAKYYYAIGTTSGGTNVVGWTSNGTSTSVTHTGLSLTNGQTYYISVKAENGSGLQTAVTTTNGQTVDVSTPDVVYVADGTGLDITYTTTNEQLSANWTASSDAQSGITKYWYAIGTTSGGTEIVDWTDNGLNQSVTHTGLSLANGLVYYISVKAEDGAGLFATAISSNGQKVDITVPVTIATVNDGTAADVDYTTTINALSGNWSASSDTETDVAKYWYAIGTATGATDFIDWTDNGLSTSFSITPATTNGQWYCLTVKAENNAGLISTPANSDCIQVDTTAPDAVATVYDGPNAGIDRSYTTNDSQLTCNWDATTDPQSGIKGYWYAIGTTSGGTDIVGWTYAGYTTIAVASGLTLVSAQSYYCSVKAENNAGLISTVTTSDGIVVDLGYPTDIETVNDGTGADVDYIYDTTQLSANWSESTDTSSGIKKYWYSIGTAPGNMTVTGGWVDNALATSVTRTGLTLTQGQVYYFRVKAENNAGLTTNLTTSDGQTVDIYPPEAPAYVYDGAVSHTDILYDTSNTSISANWSTSTPGVSYVRRYWFAVGTTSGGTDILGWTDVGTVTKHTQTGLSLTNGTIYYISIKAESGAGLMSSVTTSNGQKVDITPPDIVSIYDGTGSDVAYTTTDTQLSAHWTDSSDTESDVAKYWYAIGTTSGGTEVVDWTDNGTATSFTKTGLTLTNGTIYYVTVKAENGAEEQSAATVSNGQKVDITQPADTAYVYDGTAADIDYVNDTSTTLSANWAASSDAQSDIGRYWYAIGTTSGGTEVVGWTDNGLNTNVTKNGLTLTDGVKYYFAVKVENGAGLISGTVVSDGQTVDTTQPDDIASVSDGTGADLAYATSATTLSANWADSVDTHTGIAKYYYAIGTTSGGTDITGWTDVATSTSITKSGLTLSEGQSYYFSVKAENAAGLQSNVAISNGAVVDITQPSEASTLYDGPDADIAFASSTTVLAANWQAASDAQSGIARYWYAIGTTAGGTDVVGWTDNGTLLSVTHTGLSLTDGQMYYFTVKAENGAGLIGTAINSDGQTVDASAPTTIASVSDGTSADVTYITTDSSLSANWTASADPGSGLKKYWYSVGTTPGGTNTVGWTNNNLDTSVTVTSLGLANGQIYYVNVRAENNADTLGQITSSNGQTVDITPPDIPAFVFDGSGTSDIAYSTSAITLSGSWAESADDQSGILKYQYAVGTTAGGSEAAGWTDIGTATHVTRTGLSLADGTTYYFNVRAVNNAGLTSDPASSDGILVDASQPNAVASVADGTGTDIAYINVKDRISANWPVATDPHSGIVRYWYEIGTVPDGSDVCGWTDNGLETSFTRTGLSLTDNKTYYVTVRAENTVGLLSASKASNGQYVDSILPTQVTVNDGTGADINYTQSNTQLSANWTQSYGQLTQIVKYYYQIGTSSGGGEVVGWTDNGLSTSVTKTGLTLVDGTKYYFSVKAESAAGLQAVATSSDGQTVDSSAPGAIATVNDSTGADTDITTNTTALSANWSASAEPDSPFVYYYSIGTSAGATDFRTWATTTAMSITVSDLSLTDGATYFFNVKAQNVLGLESAVTSSDGITVNANPPTVLISSPEQNATVSGTVTVTGTATDASLTQWTLEYGPGSAPTAWKQIATGTTGVSSGTLGSWDTSSLSGTYSLRLSAQDTLDGASETTITVTLSNSATFTGTVPEGEWRLLSLPAAPANSDPVKIFGTESMYKLYKWDPTADDDPVLGKYRSPSSVGAGDSFWIKAYSTDLNYSYTASVNNTTQDTTLTLKTGWNQIGCPFNRNFAWSDVQVRSGGTTYDLTTAAGMNLISASIYSYNATTGSWTVNDTSYIMTPQTGLFVKAFADVELIFSPGAGLTGGLARAVRSNFDYTLSISASASGYSDTDNVIGAANFTNTGADIYDAPEPPQTPNSDYTSLYFPHDDWDSLSGGYAHDFRASARKSGDTSEWAFNVATSKSGATVTLTWDNSSLPAAYSFMLIDLASGERIDMTKSNSYTFTASTSGTEAAFKIEVTLTASSVSSASIELKSGWNLVSVPLEPETSNALALLAGALGNVVLYQYYDGAFYPAAEADVQAGIGFWVYVPDNLTISVPGAPMTDGVPVEVPLKKGWNAIGDPFAESLTWGDNIGVSVSGAESTLSNAAAAGVVSADIYLYTGSAYEKVSPGGSLAPSRGYFIKAKSDCTLIMK